MLQPVVVRQTSDGFELISGERRIRAATQLEWQDVPALVRSADERTMLTLALIENLQREDLNSIEEAHGYERLIKEFNLTHQQIADAVGKDRSTVTNILRLLSLPDDVQQLLEQARITMGHARALLSTTDPRYASVLAREIVAQDLSVRETERRVRESVARSAGSTDTRPLPPGVTRGPAANTATQDPAIRQVEDRLRRHFQTDVRIRTGQKSQGTIELAFYSPDDLSRLIEIMVGAPTVGD